MKPVEPLYYLPLDTLLIAANLKKARALKTQTRHLSLMTPLLLSVAACSGGSGGGIAPTPPPPAPPPPPPSVGPTAVADGPTAIVAGAAAITGNLITNDTQGSGAAPTVTAFGIQSGAAGTVGQALGASLGSLTVQSTGAYSFTVASNAAVAALAPGQTQDVVFTYTIGNTVGTSSSILTVRVTGINDAPAVQGLAFSAVEDGVTQQFGNLTFADVDAGQSVTVSGAAAGTTAVSGNVNTRVAGTYGSLRASTGGAVDYLVNTSSAAVQGLRGGQIATDTFTVQVSDGAGGFASTQVVITLTGVNDAPTVVNDVFTLAQGSLSLSGNVLTNDSDIDSPSLLLSRADGFTFAGTTPIIVQRTGTFTFNANGTFDYGLSQAAVDALGAGQSIYERVSVTVSDGSASAESRLALNYTKLIGNRIVGTPADDTFRGTDGDDRIEGGPGDDILRGGLGRDSLFGGDGDDQLINDLITENGNTILNVGNLGSDQFTGGAGNDRIAGALGGFDIAIYAGKFSDYTIDTSVAGRVRVIDNNLADGDEGTDTLTDIERLVFSDVNIDLGVFANNRPILGQPNTTSTVAQSGTTTTINILSTAIIDIDLDPITYSVLSADGSAAPAYVTVNQATRQIIIAPPAGINQELDLILVGSDGFQAGLDRFSVFVWNPAVSTVSGAATVSGTAAAEQIVATASGATLNGSGGADVLVNGSGAPFSRVSYSASTSAVTINLLTNTNTGGDAAGDRLYGFGTIEGTAFDDSFTAGVDLVTFIGGAGNDTFFLNNDEANTVFFNGGSGDDRFVVSAGRAQAIGGAGIDIFEQTGTGSITTDYSTSASRIVLSTRFSLGLEGEAAGDIFRGQNFGIIGSNFNDIILISAPNALTASGGGGNDLLIGVRSTALNGDFLSGGAGNDIFSVFGGRHGINGDEGVDTIIINSTATTANTENYDVRIFGFAQTERDKLDLSNLRDTQGNVLDFQDILSNTTDTGADLRLDVTGFLLETGVAAGGNITFIGLADVSLLQVGDFIFSGGGDTEPLPPIF
jgi:VCBS repeat-containing protein